MGSVCCSAKAIDSNNVNLPRNQKTEAKDALKKEESAAELRQWFQVNFCKRMRAFRAAVLAEKDHIDQLTDTSFISSYEAHDFDQTDSGISFLLTKRVKSP